MCIDYRGADRKGEFDISDYHSGAGEYFTLWCEDRNKSSLCL
jgi:hypothetical protein